jgi:transcriptional regulator with XRE-family HTH domain
MDRARVQRRFGEAVRGRRERLGLSQEDLAHRAQMHPTYLSQIERGKRNLSLFNIVRLAEALELPPGRLLGRAFPGK